MTETEIAQLRNQVNEARKVPGADYALLADVHEALIEFERLVRTRRLQSEWEIELVEQMKSWS